MHWISASLPKCYKWVVNPGTLHLFDSDDQGGNLFESSASTIAYRSCRRNLPGPFAKHFKGQHDAFKKDKIGLSTFNKI